MSITESPLQAPGEAGVAEIVGSALTLSVSVALLEHPLASVPVTVKVVVADGVAVTVVPVEALSSVAGDQV